MTRKVALDDIASARGMGRLAASKLALASDLNPVLLVRANDNQADEQALAALGLGSITDPYLRMTTSESTTDADALLAQIEAGVDWLVVTSQMAVPSWSSLVGRDRLADVLTRAQSAGMRIAVVGGATAESLESLGVSIDLIPAVASAAGLLAELPASAGRVVFPHGSIAMRALPDGLASRGWEIMEGVVYETTVVPIAPVSTTLLRSDDISAIILRSPSAALAVAQHLGRGTSIPVIVSGTTTAAAAQGLGFALGAIADSPSPEDVARAVMRAITA